VPQTPLANPVRRPPNSEDRRQHHAFANLKI
jgi:hypothetical protein